MADVVHCPRCNCEIEIAGALAAQVRGDLQKQLEAESQLKNEELAKRESALNARQKSLEQEVAQRLEKERAALETAVMEKVKKTSATEISDLTTQLTEAQAKLQDAQKAELAIRRERRELEQKQKELELEVVRTVDAERQKIQEQAAKTAADAVALNVAEKDKLIQALNVQVGDLKRKIEQGSQQTQGEVLEEELEKLLAQQFPGDEICPVPKGVHGGDVIHRVIDGTGRACGTILWETKRTKRWGNDWLPKLRDDQRTAKAQIAILVSVELPKDVANFTQLDGVWISNRTCAMGLAHALRTGLMEVGKTLASLEGRQEKMDLVYGYLSSPEFKNRVEGIVEAFKTMREDLEAEKRATQRHWAKREKQLELAVKNTGGLYGDLEAILGNALPAVDLLALPSAEGEE
jgi:hypothetical protein